METTIMGYKLKKTLEEHKQRCSLKPHLLALAKCMFGPCRNTNLDPSTKKIATPLRRASFLMEGVWASDAA